MLISKFSKNGKSGFAVGSNSLTPEKLAAGAVTVASGLLISAIGGIIRIKSPKKAQKSTRAKGAKSAKPAKKKRPIWLALLPLIFGAVKTKIQNNLLADIASQAAEESEVLKAEGNSVEVVPGENLEPGSDGIEVVNATQISSEDEVYQYI